MMKIKVKIAFVLFVIIVLVELAGGLQYIFASKINVYHEGILGANWETLTPGMQTLLSTLVRGTGTAAFVCGVSLVFLVLIPFRRGENWSRWAILSVALALLIPGLGGTLYLTFIAGKATPWWMNAIVLILLLSGFFISSSMKKNICEKKG